MIDSDTALSMEDATMVVGYISRGHQRQLTLVQSPEKLEQLASLLHRASIETEDPKELTADMVAADIEATITIHGLGDAFDNVSVEDFLNR